MKKKIGIVTSFNEYNYGAMLQAYAMQELVKKLGHIPQIVWLDSGIVKFRDIRIKKIVIMAARMMLHPTMIKRTILTYKQAYSKTMNQINEEMFFEFSDKYLEIYKNKYKNLKKMAKTEAYQAFVCGSDQIWNATALYNEPMYYLRFVPKNKRIAYAPSLGKDYIPSYNIKILSRYISEIPYLSVREAKGQQIIEELIGRKAEITLDPTLLMTGQEWIEKFNLTLQKKSYILCYFLDNPSQKTVEILKNIQKQLNIKIYFIPYQEEWQREFDNCQYSNAGPQEFLQLIANARYVITDSFHGTVFAINFNVPFFTIKREYQSNTSQSSRLKSILEILDLSERFIETDKIMYEKNIEMDFNNCNKILAKKREESIRFMQDALIEINK